MIGFKAVTLHLQISLIKQKKTYSV